MALEISLAQFNKIATDDLSAPMPGGFMQVQ